MGGIGHFGALETEALPFLPQSWCPWVLGCRAASTVEAWLFAKSSKCQGPTGPVAMYNLDHLALKKEYKANIANQINVCSSL